MTETLTRQLFYKELEEEKKREKEEQAKKVCNHPVTTGHPPLDNCNCQDDIALAVCMVVILIITCVVVIFKVQVGGRRGKL